MIRFAVTTLMTEHTEDDRLVLHLASDDHYLTLERRADFKPGRLGDIRFENDGQTRKGYDVIRTFRFSRTLIAISLDPAKAENFDGDHEFEIGFDIAEDDKAPALRFLRRFFTDTTLLVVEE